LEKRITSLVKFEGEVMERHKPYRISEFAIEIGVSRRTIERAIAAGRIRMFKFNDLKLIPAEEMDRVKAGEVVA
jgi:excisionase family DNA binding protein